jgi:hypothetical protein
MECKTLTIPYLLESVTEREIQEEFATQLPGMIENVYIVPSNKPYKGHYYCTAVIRYRPDGQNANVSKREPVKYVREEWSKSRNFP